MKKHLLFTLLASGLSGSVGCSKKDNPTIVTPSPYSQLLLGKWNVVSQEATVPQLAGPPITTLVSFPMGASYDVFTATNVESFRNNVSQRIDAYTLSNSAYTITGNGITDTYEIKELTTTKLVTSLSYPIRTMAAPGTAVVVSTYTR
jgi:hypothetical protein